MVGSLGSLGGLGLVRGLGSTIGGEAVHGIVEGSHSGVHGSLVVLGEGLVGHDSLSVLESCAEGGHGLGGVAIQVDALSLADQVLQDGLVCLIALGQDGVQQSVSGLVHLALHGVAGIGQSLLSHSQSVHQLLPGTST